MNDGSLWLGKADNFNETKIKEVIKDASIQNQVNLEKAIYALEYVAQLQDAGLDFVFKGGSAVQLLLGMASRLSVDADICTDASDAEIEKILDKVSSKFRMRGFTYEIRKKNSGKIPFYSYRIHSPTAISQSRTFLLDVMGKKPRITLQKTLLKTFFYDSSVTITTPTSGAILGDKLSTIGPETLGRELIDERNGLEYAKHFYDINNLLKVKSDLLDCKKSYFESIENQSLIRGQEFTPQLCFEDVLFTCKVASLPSANAINKINDKFKKKENTRAQKEFNALRKGLSQFRNFMLDGKMYSWDNLREYSALTALLIKMICLDISSEIQKKYLDLEPPKTKDEINELWGELQSIGKEELWFMDYPDIQNFPILLRTWHSFYFI